MTATVINDHFFLKYRELLDAEALHEGSLDPATALAEGRVRVRGDLRAIVEAVSVLAAAHARLRAR